MCIRDRIEEVAHATHRRERRDEAQAVLEPERGVEDATEVIVRRRRRPGARPGAVAERHRDPGDADDREPSERSRDAIRTDRGARPLAARTRAEGTRPGGERGRETTGEASRGLASARTDATASAWGGGRRARRDAGELTTRWSPREPAALERRRRG